MKSAFISYSTADLSITEQMRDALEIAGISCWMAPRDINPGEDYAEQIINAIEGCTVLLLVLSETSNHSQYVIKEVERAIAKRKVVIPFRIHKITPSRSLEFFISNAQWIDAWQEMMYMLPALINAVRQYIKSEAKQAPDEVDTPVVTAPTIRHNLPTQATPFVGRSEELEDLRQLLDDPTVRLITIVGSGGIGKTSLALAVAEEFLTNMHQSVSSAAAQFLDGIFFVALAPVRSTDQLPTTLAATVGYTPETGEQTRTLEQQLLGYLRQKRLLLILDNFEHLLDSGEFVSDILHQSSTVKLLVTSRERLHLNDEHLYALLGLDFAEWQTPEEAVDYSAAQLFIQSAQRLKSDFTLHVKEMPHLARICRLVGGTPLAVNLAAGWVDILSLAAIADEIQKSLDFLETELRDVPLRQRSMRATFNSSWQLLSPTEQTILAQLSIFRGTFDRQSALIVANANLRTLVALVAKSLLQVKPSLERYDIHELVKQYANAKLRDDSEQWMATQLRHCDYYADLLLVRMSADDARAHLEEVDSVFDDIEAAWRYAVENRQLTQIQKFAKGFQVYFGLHSWYRAGSDALTNYQRALACFDQNAQDPDQQMTCSCLYESIGDLRELATAHEEALAAFEHALTITVDTDYIQRGRLHSKMADVWVTMNQHERAHEQYSLAESALTETSQRDAHWWNEWLRIATQRMQLYYWQNRPGDIEVIANQIRPAIEQYGSVKQRIHYLVALGQMAIRRDRYFYSSEAIAYTDQALSLSNENGDLSEIAWRHFVHGFCHLWSDHFDEAETHLLITRTMTEQSGDLTLLARALIYLTVVYRKRGDVEKVRELTAQCLRVAGEARMSQYTGSAHAHQAWLAWRAGDLAETKRQAAAAIKDWGGLGQAQTVIMFRWFALFPLLGVALQEEDDENAYQLAQHLIAPTQQRLPDELTGLLERAIETGKDGSVGAARSLLQQAFHLGQKLHYV